MRYYIIPNLLVKEASVLLAYDVLPTYDKGASLGIKLWVTGAREPRVWGAKNLAHPCKLVGLVGVEVALDGGARESDVWCINQPS